MLLTLIEGLGLNVFKWDLLGFKKNLKASTVELSLCPMVVASGQSNYIGEIPAIVRYTYVIAMQVLVVL